MVKRVLNKLKRITNDILFSSPIYAKHLLKNTEHTILMYHGCDKNGDTIYNSRHTSKEAFEKHINYLNKNAHIISLKDFFEKRFIPGKPNFAVTFDDGYLNNFTNALPILEKLETKATFFITGLNNTKSDILWADFLNIASMLRKENVKILGEVFEKRGKVFYSLNNNESLYKVIKEINTDYNYKLQMIEAFGAASNFKRNPDLFEKWELMKDKDILACSQSKYIEIGAHGFFHNNLGKLTDNQALKELSDVKIYLENLIQLSVDSIGYPDGSYNRNTLDISEKLGYKFQLAAEGFHFSEDYYDNRLRDRKGVYSSDSTANQLIVNF
jgi:peptidoglycan/xylan/chitin deacetylase (PgdA/CDA1 family)